MANKPQLLAVPQLAQIHLKDPHIGKAIQSIVEYINANVTPVAGTKIPSRKTPGGNP